MLQVVTRSRHDGNAMMSLGVVVGNIELFGPSRRCAALAKGKSAPAVAAQGECTGTHLREGGASSPTLPQAAPRPQPDSDVVPVLPSQRQVPGGGAGWGLSTCQQQAREPCATRVRPTASQSESESEVWGWRDPLLLLPHWHGWQVEASLVHWQTWSGVHLSCCLLGRVEQSHRSPGSQPPGPR